MINTIVYLGSTITVHDDGTVIWNNQVRKHHLDACGYPVVSIKTEKGWRNIGVARLIAMAFIPNPNNLPEVDHINYNRQDYSINNLQWVSHKDNVSRSVINRPDLTGNNNPNFGNHKLHEKYIANPQLAKEKQGRRGQRNGRYKTGKYVKESVTTIP